MTSDALLVLLCEGLHSGHDRILHLLHGSKDTLEPGCVDGGATEGDGSGAWDVVGGAG